MTRLASGDRPALAPADIADDEFRPPAENIPTLCWIANGDGYIVWYNRRWYEYTGTTPEEMEGWGWQSVHDPERLPEVMERWTNSIATGQPFEMTFPLRGADGVFRPFFTRVQPVRVAGDSVVRWFGVNTDVSGQAATEERYREVFENAAVGMIEIDAAWNILKSNAAYREITGRAEEDLRGANSLSFTHPDDVSAGEDALRAWRQGRQDEWPSKSAIFAPARRSSGFEAAFRESAGNTVQTGSSKSSRTSLKFAARARRSDRRARRWRSSTKLRRR